MNKADLALTTTILMWNDLYKVRVARKAVESGISQEKVWGEELSSVERMSGLGRGWVVFN